MERLYRDLELRDAAKTKLEQHVESLADQEAKIDKKRESKSDVFAPFSCSTALGPSKPAKNKVCMKCSSKLTSTDVESALDMAIALGQAEQELNDRERKIVHLESKVMALEDDREDKYKSKIRCWVVDSKFDALETQSSAASRDLFDAV